MNFILMLVFVVSVVVVVVSRFVSKQKRVLFSGRNEKQQTRRRKSSRFDGVRVISAMKLMADTAIQPIAKLRTGRSHRRSTSDRRLLVRSSHTGQVVDLGLCRCTSLCTRDS